MVGGGGVVTISPSDAVVRANVLVARTALRRYRERYELLTGRAP